jgi:hypothetical protein
MWHAWERNVRCRRESPNERDHSEDRGVDGRMGSEWILERLAGGGGWIQLAQNGTVAGCCKRDDKFSGLPPALVS